MMGYGCAWYYAAPLLILGPPGVGKTAWASGLAEQLGVPLAVLAAAGLSDNRALEGTARGWSNCIPCLPALVAADDRCANPLLLVDEIDKAGGSERGGDIRSTLLTLLEPETARRHWDACLHGHLDLSWVSWVLTANHPGAVPVPLVSRCHVVEVASPGVEHVPVIVEGVRARVNRRFGVPLAGMLRLGDTDLTRLAAEFRRHGDIQRVRRAVETILGRLAWARRAADAASPSPDLE